MSHSVKFDRLKRSYLFILIPALVALFISLNSLIIYLMQLASIEKNYHPNIMNPVVSFGYLLGSLALLLLYFRPHKKIKIICGRLAAGILLIFSLLTLLEFVFLFDIGVVKYIYYAIEEATPFYKQNLSIESGVIFLFLGVSLLLNSYQPLLNKISIILNTMVFLISLTAIMGYLFGVEEFYKYNHLPVFNILSAFCAFSLAIAGFFARPLGSYFTILMSKGSAGIFARRVSVACLLLPPFFGKIGHYYSNSGVPDSLAFAVVAILCLLAMVGIIWKSSAALELVDKYRIGSEQEKLKSMAQMDAILAKAPIGIALFGLEGGLIRANQIFKEYLLKGESKNNIMSLPLIKNNTEGLQDHKISDLIHTELPGKSFEIEVATEDKPKYLNINFFPIKSSAGEVMGLGCSFAEITHLKEIEKELIMARDIANSSNKAKSQFLANMSHEIRTPIGVIMGFMDILKNKNVSEEEWDNNMAIIQRNCRQLLNIIDDILDLSKVEAGRIKLHFEEINTKTLIEDLKSILELRTAEKKIKLEVLIQEPIPPNVISDNTRMRQVVLNVCGNAIKFTKKGKVTLECFCREKKLFFRVIDQGCGIPNDQLEKLFKPFSQVDSSETREFGGNGLGLALSQKLARALGGDVEIEHTEENVGSTFLISFDTGVAMQSEGLQKRRYAYAGAELQDDEKEEIKCKKVLVVDDSPDNRLLISHLLKSEEIEVETAKDGSEGYNKAKEKGFDLVLLDLQMPVMGGYETAKKLRESGFHNPIVALTAHAMIGEKENCLNAGFDDYLTKPIDKKKLMDVLKYNFQGQIENTL